MNAEISEFRGGQRIVLVSGVLGAIGIVVLIIGAFVTRTQALYAYLAAYAFVVSTVLGALIFLMTVHAMRAGWPTLLRRLTEAVVATLPLLAVLSLPILIGIRPLYPWMRLESIADLHEREIVELKLPYLNGGWFIGRTCVFFAIWIFVGYFLRRWSEAQDRDPAFAARPKMYALSGALLPIVALTLSFASFDWLMSLTPTWYSTMFPVYFFGGGFVGAIAVLTVLAAAADRAGAIAGINPSHYYALGRLLLAFTIFWAYVGFFQFMLIWIANKPDEATFYLARVKGAWRYETVVLVVTQFALPFLVLLNYDIKRRRGPLTAVAVWIIAAHYIDMHWLVMPTARPVGPPVSWVDLAALLAVSGVTVAFAVIRLRGRALVPVHDPILPKALRYDSL